MSYYYGQQRQQHPFFHSPAPAHPQGHAARHPHPPSPYNFFLNHAPPAHHLGSRHPYHIYGPPQHPFFDIDQFDEHPTSTPAPAAATPTPAPATTLEDEEKAALAHLRSIQRRKEAEQDSIRREAAIRLQAKQEREAAIRRAMIEKEREELVVRAIRQKEIEHQKRQAIRAALEEKRNAEIQKKREYIQAVQNAKQQYFQQLMAQKAECAKRYAARYAAKATKEVAKEVKKEYGDEFEQLNKVLAGLFGINLAPAGAEEDKKVEVKAAEKQVDVKEKKEEVKEKKEVHFDQPKPSTESKGQAAFPEDVNDLLTQFLGLRVEPTSETTKPSSSSNNVPEGLNEFLSRFGLVFEPLDVEKEVSAESKAVNQANGPSSASNSTVAVPDPEVPSLASAPKHTAGPSSSKPAAPAVAPKVDDAPLTAFLNSFTDLPPFVRDILGNVELAFKEELNKDKKQEEEVAGKGKGVAAGEKKSTPTPAQAPASTTSTNSANTDNSDNTNTSTTSLNRLQSISHELSLVKESFEFPSTLSFGPSATAESTPNLLFNKTNSGYHAQANKLLSLLLQADDVSSGGDKEIRKLRKEIVKDVEGEIENLERLRDVIWADIKLQRENGEAHEEQGSESSGSSVIDAAENHTLEHYEQYEAVEEDEGKEEEAKEEEVKGFEIPSTTTTETKGAEPTVIFDSELDTNANAGTEDKEVNVEKEETPKKEDASDEKVNEKAARVQDEKEEGYELL